MVAFLFAAIFSSAVSSSVLSQATVAIGLAWDQNIFVQEYWQSGKPYYAVANQGTATASITVFDRGTGDKLLGPWVVGPKQIIYVKVEELQNRDLLEFKLQTGQSLGFLDAPRALPGRSQAPGKIITYDGLNGSGGRHDDLWFEQPALEFRPRSIMELILAVRSNIGEITFLRSKTPILEAKCNSLKIQTTAEKFIIDTNKPDTRLHRITLRLRAPSVDHPTMLVIEGWHWIVPQQMGHSVARGIVINPRK